MSTVRQYQAYQGKKRLLLICLLALVLILALIALCVGSFGISPLKTLAALFGQGEANHIIAVRSIRLPRIIGAILAGIGLAGAGCIMQSTLHNPMASPSTLGVGNAAVFGANFAIILLGGGAFSTSLSISNPYLVTSCAFLCAFLSILLILLLSTLRGCAPETIVLSGVALGSLFSAATTVLQYFASDTQLAAAVFWTFGDLGRVTHRENLLLLAIILPCVIIFLLSQNTLNALTLGDEQAQSLGVFVAPTRILLLLLASLICAVCVSFFGVIGFVGLAAPNLIRPLSGGNHRHLLPASMLTGAALLLFADIVSRSILTGVALPVGAVTSLLGAPIFLWMLLSRKGGRAS